jgi:hypothetical protein
MQDAPNGSQTTSALLILFLKMKMKVNRVPCWSITEIWQTFLQEPAGGAFPHFGSEVGGVGWGGVWWGEETLGLM